MRALIMSDTHCQHHNLDIPKKGYTLVIHTGDFSNMGREDEIDDFLLWYSKIPCRYKILVPGNHDLSVEGFVEEFRVKCNQKRIILLCDESINIQGINFYSSPYVPNFYDWAFMESEKQLQVRYARIPLDTDVLLTHGPALWHGDEVPRGHVGSEALINRIKELKAKNSPLKYHIFGHIHESAGYDAKDKETNVRFINASSHSSYYELINPKIIQITK